MYRAVWRDFLLDALNEDFSAYWRGFTQGKHREYEILRPRNLRREPCLLCTRRPKSTRSREPSLRRMHVTAMGALAVWALSAARFGSPERPEVEVPPRAS